MSKLKLTMVALSGAVVFGLSAMVMAGVPAGSETISIDLLPGSKGAVAFQHAKHATEYKQADGKAITCNVCHHTLKTPEPAAGEQVKGCASCHAKDGTSKTVDGKTVVPLAQMKDGKPSMMTIVFHKTCLDCHKKEKAAGKNIAGCNTCHKK